MKKFTDTLLKIISPPTFVTVLLCALSAAGLTFVFMMGYDEHAIGIAVYVVSFYTLCALTYRVILAIPTFIRVKDGVKANRYVVRYSTDVAFRTYFSLFINLFYAALNAVSAYLYKTAWFGIIAGYYTVLALIRFLIVRFFKKDDGTSRIAEYKRARGCAILLLTVNLSLSALVLMMMYSNRGYNYSGILIYVMAAYTFYATITSVIGLIRLSKKGDIITTGAKTVDVTAALVSMLALETAMFSQFGQDMDISSQRLMIALTGAGISIAVITISVLMTVYTTREIRKLKNGK